MSYWRDVHPQAIMELPGFSRHVRRYVQNHALLGRLPLGLPDEYDGVSELWFDRLEHLRSALSEACLGVLRADAHRFIDLRQSVSWVAEVIHVKGTGPTEIKLFAAGHARPGLTRSEAQAYWRERHPHVVARDAPECWRMIKRYDQAHTRSTTGLPLETVTDRYDFCAEVGLDSIEAAQELFTRRDYLEIVRSDELRFASVEDSLACATRERVIFAAP